MRKYIFLVVIGCLLAFGCKSLKDENSTCDVKLSFQDNYRITLPCYKRKNLEIEYHGERQYTFYYNDGAKFFVTDDVDVTPHVVYKHMDRNKVPSFVFYENRLVDGRDETNNTLWKAVKEKKLVFGYENVPEWRKAEFDRAISSISKE